MVKHIKCRILEDSESKTKLKVIPRGKTFEYRGREWIVLEHNNEGGTLVLLKNPIGRMPFDKNNCNNWEESSLRQYLNTVFLDEMLDGIFRLKLGFHALVTDLTADDGLKNYGSSVDIVSLLTCDLYRKHRDIIKPIDEWWWLATPYSNIDNNAYKHEVRLVGPSGTLVSDFAHNRNWLVRPICYLSSDVLVEARKI